MMTIEELADEAFDTSDGNPLATTQALVVLRHGETVFERYGEGIDAETTLISWSMAKSITSALCGVMVDRGLVEVDTPAAVPEWQGAGDPRRAITLRNLLEMRSGLVWTEDYVDDQASDVIDMLFGSGKHDVAAHAAAKPLGHAPGTHWYYSSGTTNIVSRLLGDALASAGETMCAALDELFEACGMGSATAGFDDAGTFIGSSFVYATARDYAAFGEVLRRAGQGPNGQVMSAKWIEESVREHAVDPESGQGYGRHWWLVRDDHGSFAANGYEGQRLQIVPDLGLTFVRLGKTDADHAPALRDLYRRITACFA